jgi:CubicO group peptidase (beta-lactamase class C family)
MIGGAVKNSRPVRESAPVKSRGLTVEPQAASEDATLSWREEWDKKMNGKLIKFLWSGAYYQFQTPQCVLREGSDGDFSGDTPCALTSCTKVFTGAAVMRTMHLRPQDWYPEKFMHEFFGWENWKDFAVLDNEPDSTAKNVAEREWSQKRTANVTIHQLLTHTSGWPFGLRGTRKMIRATPLYFMPGTNFGYSIGHRILGWMLLDYWKTQPDFRAYMEFKQHFGEVKLNDVFQFLVYDPLEMSAGTKFIQGKFEEPHSVMGEFFDMKYFDEEGYNKDNDPADLAMQCTGKDMMKLCMMAMRRGQLPNGTCYIPEDKWNRWAATNQLPGGKLSTGLAHWRMAGNDISFLWRTAITRTTNAGPFGWSYFGATYHDCEPTCEDDAGPVIAVGWKGFSSCGLRADYTQGVAFVGMQECVPDPRNRNFAECIHKGKVGSYTLKFVGDMLASEAGLIDLDKQDTDSQSCHPFSHFHEVLQKTDDADCIVQCVRGIVKCLLGCALPAGVDVLDFHKRERVRK